jgi:RimJ/RimL family protein N-acetyltransferase
MSVGLLFECDDAVAHWLFSTNGWAHYKYDRAIGLIDKDKALVGGILFQSWNGSNVEVSYYGKGTLTAGIVCCIARYTLATFDPARLTVVTSKRNRQLMKALQKLGFKIEGAQRCFYGKRDCNRNTGIRFVAFREDIEKVAKVSKGIVKCS